MMKNIIISNNNKTKMYYILLYYWNSGIISYFKNESYKFFFDRTKNLNKKLCHLRIRFFELKFLNAQRTKINT